MKNLRAYLDVVIDNEGGYVNHAKDPGKETNLGITLATAGTWDLDLDGDGDVDRDDLLLLTPEIASDAYRKHIWDPLKCEELPVGIDLIMLDMGVHLGTGRAAKILQESANAILPGTSLVVDGQVGERTIGTVNQKGVNWSICSEVTARRNVWYSECKNPKTGERLALTFGLGWFRRSAKCHQLAVDMMKELFRG